jgi:DNA-binding transcriptional ArsR family regulator
MTEDDAMSDFSPAPLMILETPEQIKAFTDPLRLRVLRILRERPATNQQIADELGEPHAKVLYHIRFLLEAGLIKLIDTHIKGGNVEKYYRAVARIFDLRPAQQDTETDIALINSMVDTLRADLIASVVATPDFPAQMRFARSNLTPDRQAEFDSRLAALIAEYWPPGDVPEGAEAPMQLAVFIFRGGQGQ